MKMYKLAIAAVLMFGTTHVIGGEVVDADVSVTVNPDGSGTASGDMVTARFSDNLLEAIGCGVRKIVNPDFGFTFEFAFCRAVAADETTAFCTTEDPFLVDAVQSISDFSFIVFAYNADDVCTRIGNSTQSIYIPDFAKKPKKSK